MRTACTTCVTRLMVCICVRLGLLVCKVACVALDVCCVIVVSLRILYALCGVYFVVHGFCVRMY